jgi:hypothetical protein
MGGPSLAFLETGGSNGHIPVVLAIMNGVAGLTAERPREAAVTEPLSMLRRTVLAIPRYRPQGDGRPLYQVGTKRIGQPAAIGPADGLAEIDAWPVDTATAGVLLSPLRLLRLQCAGAALSRD